jgi:hypothetical protein
VHRENRLELVVETIQRQANQARAIERAERDASKAPKLPSEKFQFAHRKWMLVAGVSDEQDLPRVYHDFANAAKGELRLCLQDHLDSRAQEEDAASATKVLATVACFEAIKAGDFGRLVSLDDLSAGIQPFACGYDAAPAHASVAATIAAFDMMAASQVQASLPEHRELAAKTAHFPQDGLEFQQMLGTTSLFVDVLQGDQHPHAKAFRRFVRSDIPILQAALRSWDAATAQYYYGNFYPTIMRAIQIAMITYWADLTDGLDPELPDYRKVRQLIVARSMNLFTPVPRSYLVVLSLPTTAGTPGAQQPTNNRGGSAADMGQVAVNTLVPTNRGWMTVFARSGKTVGELGPVAPKDSQGRQLCLKYHLEGKCWTNCTCQQTHSVLVGADKLAFQSFVDRHIVGPQDWEMEEPRERLHQHLPPMRPPGAKPTEVRPRHHRVA